jgi:GNAT superfamily N-acetyltransferase
MNMAVTELKRPKRTVRTPHINIRVADPADATMIADFLGQFFARSIWTRYLNFHHERTRIYLAHALGTPFAMYAIALDTRDDNKLVGICSYHVYGVFSDPMAVMDETYTSQKYHRTDLGRRLVGMAIDMARADGCKVMNFPICSGMKEQNSLMNMVGRHFGAEPIGMIFRKAL